MAPSRYFMKRSSSAGVADAMANKQSSSLSRNSSATNTVPSSPPIVNRFFESRMTQFNHQPKYQKSNGKKALRITGYVVTLGISYIIRKNKKKTKLSSVESLDSLSTTSWEEDSMSSTESSFEISPSSNQREHSDSLPIIIHHRSSFNDEESPPPMSTFAAAIAVSNTTTVTNVPDEAYNNRLLTTTNRIIDRLTDEIPIDRIADEAISKVMSSHFTSTDRNAEIEELNKMLIDKVNEVSDLIDSHKVTTDERDLMLLDKDKNIADLIAWHQSEIEERDRMLLEKINEISHLVDSHQSEIYERDQMLLDKTNEISDLIAWHQSEIEERDEMLLEKINEISNLVDSHQAAINERDNMLLDKDDEVTHFIDSHQAELAKVDQVVYSQRTEIAYLKDELGLHDDEIAKCYKTISDLENEMAILKQEKRGSREETAHQSCQTDQEIADQPVQVYVTKEWHEKEMGDFVQLVNNEHQHFVQAIQEEILDAENRKEIAEREARNISHQKLLTENLMLKVDLSVLNDIHEADMTDRNRVISDLFKENKTLRANLTAAVNSRHYVPVQAKFR